MSTKYCEICGKELTVVAGQDIPYCASCINRSNIKITTNKGEKIMKNYIKLGFGAYIGWTLAKVAHKIVGKALGLTPEKKKTETVESDKD